MSSGPWKKGRQSEQERKAKEKEYHRQYYQKNKERLRPRKRELKRKYWQENPDKFREQTRRSKAKLKSKVFDLYGRKCLLCGFEDIRTLTLDHINNNGAEERKLLGERGVYRRAIESYKPNKYRIICMNCQFIKRVEANRQNQYGSRSG